MGCFFPAPDIQTVRTVRTSPGIVRERFRQPQRVKSGASVNFVTGTWWKRVGGSAPFWPVPVTLNAKIPARCKEIGKKAKIKKFNTPMKFATNAVDVLWFARAGMASHFLPAKTIPVAETLDPLVRGWPVPNRLVKESWWREHPRKEDGSMAAVSFPSAGLSLGQDQLIRNVPSAAILIW
jgi:hypothetical protein